MTPEAPKAPPRALTTVVPPSREAPVGTPQVAIEVTNLSFFYGS